MPRGEIRKFDGAESSGENCKDREESLLAKSRPDLVATIMISPNSWRHSSKERFDREGCNAGTGRGREAGPSKERARAEQGQLGGQVRDGELSEDSAISEYPQI